MATNKAAKAAKQAINQYDESLKFIQTSFNIENNTFDDIVRNLEAASVSMKPGMDQRLDKEQAMRAREAQRLLKEVKQITLLRDFNKYTKFDDLSAEVEEKLGEALGASGIEGIYRVSDEIIKDINVARDWIESYKQYDKRFNDLKLVSKFINQREYYNMLRMDLILLGQSILGRAIEMTPMDTGTLRRSGILIDQGDKVTIAFTAPYASYVHENLAIHHPWHMDSHGMQRDCGGQAKFLELALQEFFPDRHVWTEIHGYQGVSVTISINPLFVEYKHYD